MSVFPATTTKALLPKIIKTGSSCTYILASVLSQTVHATLFVGYNAVQPQQQLVFKQMPRSEAAIAEAELHGAANGAEGVVPLLDTFVTRNHVYLALPFYSRGDLFDLILDVHERSDVSTAVRERWAIAMFSQMIHAVAEMHRRGIYHRDLKAENFLVADDGRVLIADFGLATHNPYDSSVGYGSEFYMSPESFAQNNVTEWAYGSFLSQKPQPAKSDAWSLGILLLNLLRGRNPWPCAQASDPAFDDFLYDPFILKTAFSLSEDCWSLVARMLCPDVTLRANISDLIRLVDEIICSMPTNHIVEEKSTGPSSLVELLRRSHFSLPSNFDYTRLISNDWNIGVGHAVVPLHC